jgi:TolA-binding protein
LATANREERETVQFRGSQKDGTNAGGSGARPLGLILGVAVVGLVMALTGQVTSAQEPARPNGAADARRLPESLRLANGLLRERKFDLAAAEYERFLASGPTGQDADDARFGLAHALLFQGRYKESRRAFQVFLDRSPRHPRARTAWYRLGELSYILGDLPDARKALETFVRGPRDANTERAWTYLGDVCVGLNDPPAARAAYERSLADYPHGQFTDRARFGLGKALAGLGQLDAATEILSALGREGGRDWVDRAWLELGEAQLQGGRPEAALKSFEALDRAAPQSTRRPAGNLGRADALTRLGRLDEAEKLLSPLIAETSEPLAPRAVLVLATLELQRSRPTAAQKVLERGLAHFPQSPLVPSFLFRLGESLQKQSRSGEARSAFLKLVEAHPEDPWADDAMARAAGLALEAKDHDEALRLARSFSQRFPASPLLQEVRLAEARALIARGSSRDAVPLLESLLSGNREGGAAHSPTGKLAAPAIATARYELALAYRATGEAAKADALLATLAGEATSPVGAEARFLVGQNLVEQGRFAEAIEPLKQSLASGQKAGIADYALAHLATAQLGIGRIDEAWQTTATLANQFPASAVLPAARLRLAEAALDRGRSEQAAKQFRLVLAPVPAAADRASAKAAAVEPAIRARAQAGLGRALWKLGKPAEATQAFEQFLGTSGGDPQAPSVALERAGALEAAGQDPAALEAYAKVAAQYAKLPQASLAALARARLLARTGKPQDSAKVLGELLSSPDRLRALTAAGEGVDALLAERGWALLDAGKAGDADALFTELLNRFPKSRYAAEARFHLAESANQQGNHQEVVRLLRPLASPAALDAQAAHGPPLAAVSRVVPLALYRLGRSQIALGDWNAAAATLECLERDYPGHPRSREARYLRAEAALQRGEPAAAEPMFTALEAEPPAPSDPPGFPWLVRARHVQCLLGLSRWKEALERADSLRAQLPAGDPAIAELDFARGRALLGLARPEEARQALQTVIEARQGGDLAAQAHLMKGETYFHQEKFNEALREFWNVDLLYEAPRWQAAALLEAGKVYERLGQWSDAVEAYRRLQSRFPNDPRAAEAGTRQAAAGKQAKAAGGKVF